MNRKIKIILMVGGMLILLLSLIFILFKPTKNINEPTDYELEENLIEVPGFPKAQWTRKVTINIDDNIQIATNHYDGYSINIPKNWYMLDEASWGGGFKAFFGDSPPIHPDDTEAHIEEGLLLTIKTFENPEFLSALDWLARTQDAKQYFGQNAQFEEAILADYPAFIRSYALFEEIIDENNNIIEVPMEDTLEIQYILGGKQNKIFIISCLILNDIKRFKPLCEEQVKTFTIL